MTNMFLGFADGLWSLSSRCFTWLWVEGAWRPPQWRCAAGRPERPRRCTCRPSAGGSNSQRLSSPPALFPELNIQRSNSTHTDEDYNSLFFFFFTPATWPRVSACSHCESKARVLGDVPVPGEHGGPPASPWRQARPPEVSVIFGNAEGIGDIKVQQLFKDLRRKERETRKYTELLWLCVSDGMMIMHERW